MKNELATFSPYIIPVLVILYIYRPIYRPIIYVHCICIFMIGILNAICKKKKYQKKYKTSNMLLSIFGYTITVLPLIYYKTIYYPNPKSHIGLVFVLLLIKLMPIWNYILSKNLFIEIYLFLYLMLTLIIRFFFIN